ncbi:dienelactone hydrolase family protein [Alteromonas sp. ASW11-36]|uniref:Dienelactone hydrolase family protein n=1 Tax=Alteromonas arenosi TaxID=3055817 RepID=A0ABT7SXP0_9ALTE|nr:dienelactone hydrolase family protein [Alteromonas sp. ASW11-36]MDM7860947.1 dienelactone hydrolase family protein [Alteromonas sp. ASW11-36]
MKRLAITLIMSVFAILNAANVNAEITETSVSLPNGLGTATMYSDPTQTEKRPGVIVIHEWWGLNQYAKDRAKMLAEEGYTAIAVDMYGHGKVADHPSDAQGFMQAAIAEPEKVNARFNAAKDILRQQTNVNPEKVYAMGYCFGGAVVLNQARMGNDLAGVASFHGSLGAAVEAKPGDITAKVLVAHGGADPLVPDDQVTAFMQEMLSLDVDLQFLNYPQAMHSFTNPEATEKGKKFELPLAYDEQADTDSWQAFLAFIKE